MSDTNRREFLRSSASVAATLRLRRSLPAGLVQTIACVWPL